MRGHMAATSIIEKINEILPTLAPNEQDSVLEHIEYLRGPLMLETLSDEDHTEFERRIATIDLATAIPLEQVISEARAKIARYK